ncbi:hypothetical protein FACS189447_00630 [Spirochaetia bacterium]|nr:hypothetical protein FACS189447_00630 [Spirochaetia bacterium]
MSGNTNPQIRMKHRFDMVQDSQALFRLLLDALANPGRLVNMADLAERFAAHGRWLAPAAVLLDNEIGFFWDGDQDLGEEIRFISGAAEVPPEEADFVFLSGPSLEKPAAFLSRIKQGSLLDPHDSALLLIAVSGKKEIEISLKGPGIPPEGRRVEIGGEEALWIRAREEQGYEYPCGVELVFLREDNSFWALTRKAEAIWLM